MVYSDICGLMEVTSILGSKYMITFINDFSHKFWVFFIKKKDEALEKFKMLVTEVER